MSTAAAAAAEHAPAPITHFFVHGEKAHREYGRRRSHAQIWDPAQSAFKPLRAARITRYALCERRVRASRTRRLSIATKVTCPVCSVIKDMWLQSACQKPLTIRRLRALFKANGTDAWTIARAKVVSAPVVSAPVPVDPEVLARTARINLHAAKQARRAKKAEQLRASIARLTTKLKRTQTLLKKAERRLKATERAIAKGTAPC